MAILTRQAILRAIADGDITVTPFRPEMVGPNSVDLFIQPTLKVWRAGRPLSMITAKEDHEHWFPIPVHQGVALLEPGELYLGQTVEETYTPFHVPYVDGRSSVARLGICIHQTAGRGDVGFRGHWTCEISCIKPVIVRFDIPWAQLTIHTVEGEPEEYQGRYNNQKQATPSRI